MKHEQHETCSVTVKCFTKQLQSDSEITDLHVPRDVDNVFEL